MIDVCLLLEGTYPYVAGGVSTWVHQLITAMKDIRFGIVYIAPHSDPTRTVKYAMPSHVLYLKEINLHDYDLKGGTAKSPTAADYDLIRGFYRGLVQGDLALFENFVKIFQGDSRVDWITAFTARETWNILTEIYEKTAPEISFLDFFWTWRGTHLPLMQVLRAEIPPAKIYHSVSTGYAGVLGAIAKSVYGQKFFLTEHGIYTHERTLEISQASWIFEQEKRHYRAERDLSFFKKWWIGMFKIMSHLAYQYADRIFTLYEGNKVRQTLEGASPDKISVIPNGIDLKSYLAIRREKKPAPQIGLIGRVVMIKDIKTYIQAAKFVLAVVPDAEFYIIGPTDEEEEYFEECRLLTEALGVEKNVRFTGRQDIKEYYKFLDVVVLTSVSEAQPYVILEANIAGIPVVATDVGACREMIEGRTSEDAALGPSGVVTEVANPSATADAIVKLITNDDLCKVYGKSGIARVKRYYDQDDLLSRYLNIYEKNL